MVIWYTITIFFLCTHTVTSNALVCWIAINVFFFLCLQLCWPARSGRTTESDARPSRWRWRVRPARSSRCSRPSTRRVRWRCPASKPVRPQTTITAAVGLRLYRCAIITQDGYCVCDNRCSSQCAGQKLIRNYTYLYGKIDLFIVVNIQLNRRSM